MKKSTILILALLMIAGNFAYAQRITVTLAGTGVAGFSGDGQAAKLSKISGPNDVCMDAANNIYFVDEMNGRIRKVSATNGVISTIAGGGTSYMDGVPAITASLSPRYMCIDAVGNIYVATGYQVRKINMATGIINTVAGSTTGGYGGDGGPAISATLSSPEGICIDLMNNIYIVDDGNNRIRKVDGTTGYISTICGTGGPGHSGDGGPALTATLASAYAIAVNNTTGDVYFSDQGGVYVRKIIVSTGYVINYAGNGGGVADAHGQPATSAAVGEVYGLKVDPSGNVYCCDGSCSCTEIDERTGLINLEAGSLSTDSYNGDGYNAIGTYFMWPGGMWVDALGSIYVADNMNNRIRKAIQLTHTPSFVYGKGEFIYPCSGGMAPIDSNLTITDIDSAQTETWTVISAPAHGTVSGFPATASSFGTYSVVKPSRVYYTPAIAYQGIDSFQVQVSDGALTSVITIYVANGAGVLTGPDRVCVAGSITLADDLGAGAWSVTNANAGISSGMVTGSSGGIDTVIYTVNNIVCGVVTTDKVINIDADAPPTAGTISGLPNVCAGAAITLTDGVTGGAWTASNTNATVSTSGVVSGVAAGVTDIYYTLTNGCGSTVASAVVNVVPIPDAGTISGAATICKGETTAFTDGAAGGVWSASNTNVFVSTTGVVSGLKTGTTNLYYTVSNYCGTVYASESVVVSVCGNVGVQPVTTEPVLKIFPNPAASFVSVEGSALHGIATVVITDVAGRVVLRTELVSNSNRAGATDIDVSSLKDGVYMIAITSGADHFTDKLVVSK